jgi:hypothetical protein
LVVFAAQAGIGRLRGAGQDCIVFATQAGIGRLPGVGRDPCLFSWTPVFTGATEQSTVQFRKSSIFIFY